jgi:hypothetical protein
VLNAIDDLLIDSFMNPGRDHVRGGVNSKYSQVIQEGCEYQFNQWVKEHRLYDCFRNSMFIRTMVTC